jgi:hypothetical protein
VVGIAALTITVVLAALVARPSRAYAVDPVTPVALGTAGTYSALGRTNVVNSLGPTTLSGDLGVTADDTNVPGTITGFGALMATVGGATHVNDAPAIQAQADLVIAYDDAKGRPHTPSDDFGGDQNGVTFHPGIHHTIAAFALTGTLTLDGDGDPASVFIFQVDAALNTAAASHVILTNGAQASHVFWQVLGAAGTGASSTFAGTILASGAITLGNLSVLEGAALSRGVVTLSANTVTTPIVGVLSITVPSAAADLGSRANTLAGGVVSGSLGEVRVDDERMAVAGSGWVASVSSTAFTGPGGATIPATAVSYSAGTIVKVGTATYTANDPNDLSQVTPAVTATSVAGDNSATWTPTISVAIPGSSVSGTYTAIVTHSVL